MKHTPPTVLILGYIWPEITSSAAGLRDWNLAQTILDAGWQLYYASASQPNHFSQMLEKMGAKTFQVCMNDSSFDAWVKEINPDFVIFDRFVTEEQYGWRVSESCPHAVKILDTQDLHFLRKSRELALKAGKTISEIVDFECDPTSELLLREIASIYRCDGTLILSDYELDLLVNRYRIPSELLQLSRFHYDPPKTCPTFEERKDFIMIGNFRHPPNIDGIRWLHKEIWPLIRKHLPKAQVFIYGAYPPKDLMSLTNKKLGFHVKGPISDQFEALSQSRVNLAPLRFGAGIKGKITDGWWSGTPTVSTMIGAEGMKGNWDWPGFISNNAEEFAKNAVTLHSDPQLWNKHQSQGFHILKNLYSRELNSKVLIEYFTNLQNILEKHRKSFIFSSILKHHSHNSTKYFSKWIEEKNKLRS